MTLATAKDARGVPLAWGRAGDLFNHGDVIVFVSFLAGLFVAYAGVLLIPYAFLDDYLWLDFTLHRSNVVYPLMAAQGRPLFGLILRWTFRQAGGLDGLVWVRAATIVQLAGLGWALYFAMMRAGWKRVESALVAGIACLLPAEQVIVAWATCMPFCLSGILAVSGAMMAGWATDHRSRWVVLPLVPVILLTAAIIYQPTAMIYWPVIALDLFRPAGRRHEFFWRRLSIYAVLGAMAFAAAGGVLLYGVIHYRIYVWPGRGGMTRDPIGKLSGFIHMPVADAFCFFRLKSSQSMEIISTIAIAAGFWLFVGGSAMKRLGALAVAVVFILLSYAPSLLAEGNVWGFRTQIALEWMVLLLAWLAINGFWKTGFRVPALSIVLSLAAALAAYHVTAFFACPQSLEQSMLRIALSRPEARAADQIILIQPAYADTAAPFECYDEFGVPSTHTGSIPEPAIRLIRGQLHDDSRPLRVELAPNFQGEWKQPSPPGAVLIDMRRLRDGN